MSDPVRIKVLPQAGKSLRDQYGRPVHTKVGTVVTLNTYWRDRISEGDCVATNVDGTPYGEKKEKAKAKAEPKKETKPAPKTAETSKKGGKK